jgi:hypothetical protein
MEEAFKDLRSWAVVRPVAIDPRVATIDEIIEVFVVGVYR